MRCSLQRLAAIFGVTSIVMVSVACVRLREREATLSRKMALATIGEKRGESPGLVVATVEVGRGGAIIAVDAGGMASLVEQRATHEDSAFLWFSITKLFTATAIMQLHERGALDIDAPVRDLLGSEFAVRETRGRPITARDLLTHSSGLGSPSVWALARAAGSEDRPTTQALLAQLFAAHGPRLRHRPGHHHHYSNLGYLVLGRLVELADGRDYETYIREEILEVLGMTNTRFRWDPDLLELGAAGHSRRGGFYTILAKSMANPEVFGATIPRWLTTVPFEIDGAPYAGLIGTGPDLAKFLAAHLQFGEFEGRRILSPASVQEMQRLQLDVYGRPLPHTLGWHSGLLDGERYYNHMGKGGGYRPAVRIWPNHRYGIVVLTNRTRYDPRSLTRAVPR